MILKCKSCGVEQYEKLDACPICSGVLKPVRFYTFVGNRLVETTQMKEKRPGVHINMLAIEQGVKL